MTTEIFEELLKQPESAILDFKKVQYDFDNDSDSRKLSNFIKDVIAFSNTVRTEAAYIVIGVKDKGNGEKELFGLDRVIDDSIFQEKIKDKVYPIPSFLYFPFVYNGLIFGIIKFPITKYSQPISSTVKLKGLEPGKFYFRRGSMNSEALGNECVNMYKWFESLPGFEGRQPLDEEVFSIINETTKKEISLSTCVSEALKVSRKYDLIDLETFCKNELAGWNGKQSSEDIRCQYSYRVIEILYTSGDLQMPEYSSWDSSRMMEEMRKIEGIYSAKMFFNHPLMEIEEILERLSQPRQALFTFVLPNDNFPKAQNLEKLKISGYASRDDIGNLYKNIRQKFIDSLISCQRK
ncbi:AlbA family DNA-binding domain-containing protein [Niabella aquatica]